jgi:hypothetical protein
MGVALRMRNLKTILASINEVQPAYLQKHLQIAEVFDNVPQHQMSTMRV